MRSHSRRFCFPGTTPPIGITLLLRRCAPSFYPDRDREKTATGCPRLVRGSLTLVAITRCDERLWMPRARPVELDVLAASVNLPRTSRGHPAAVFTHPR